MKTASMLLALVLTPLLALWPQLLRADALDEWSWRSPVPTGNNLRGVVFGDNLFVAVGDYGTVLTSSNGLAWTQQPSGTKENLSSFTYGNRTFVAAGTTYIHEDIWTNVISASPDGINWTHRSIATTNELSQMTFVNGLFFAFTSHSEWAQGEWHYYTEIFTSADGMNWPDHPAVLLPGEIRNVAFGNGMIVAVSGVSEAGIVWTSPDGANWTKRDTAFANAYFLGVAFGGGIFVTVGGTKLDVIGTPLASGIWTSTDGVTWTERRHGTGADWGLYSVRFGGGLFFASSGYSLLGFVSSDGVTWTEQSSGTDQGLFDITYGNGRFVGVGEFGAILTSTNGAAWTSLQNTNALSFFGSICHGNGTFVATGNRLGGNGTNVIFTSSDAISWTPRLDVKAEGGEPLEVKFLNGIFVAFGGDGILTSSDGLTWAKRSSNWRAEHVTYGNGIFCAVTSGFVSTSVDGTAWSFPQRITIENDATNTWVELECLTFGNGLFVAAGQRSVPGQQDVSGGIWTSTNGLRWTQRFGDVSFNPLLSDAAYGNGTFVVVGQRSILTSSNGITWTEREESARSVIYANGVFVALKNLGVFGGSRGDIRTSLDGIVWTSRITASPGLFGVAYGSGTFVAVGSYGAVLQSGQVGPRLVANEVSPAGVFQFKLLGEAGENCQMETSTDLKNWVPLTAVVLTNATTKFVDPVAGNGSGRFYRARVITP